MSRQGQNLAWSSGYTTVGDLSQFWCAGYQVGNLGGNFLLSFNNFVQDEGRHSSIHVERIGIYCG